MLQLRHQFTIAHDSRREQGTLIVELRDGPHRGFGEATDSKYYQVTYPELAARLQSLAPLLADYELTSPEQLWADMAPHLAGLPFAQCALDQAAHDLYGKRLGQPLYQLWGLNPAQAPVSNYTIGIDSIAHMVAKMQEMPWPIYKIKLGTAHDLEIVRTLRQHTSAKFRVDANCAWTAEQTIAYAPELKALGVEFIEQPLPAADWAGMRQAHQHSVLPLIADESCIVEADVARCAGYFHGVNIKLTKCGGLTPARRMIAQARALGLQVMVGCMNESSVGISAIGHLAPLLDYVDMDGSLLITNDPATGVRVLPTGVAYAQAGGTGASLRLKE
jgi:L-alanine-DL-glutamate epimerase-like enolase superfamily enzyme